MNTHRTFTSLSLPDTDVNYGGGDNVAQLNSSGRQVASGIYYYQLVTEGVTETKRLALVR